MILLLLVLLGGLVSLPFVMTSRALDAHGMTIPGTVYHKSEYVRIVNSSWELLRDVTVEYTAPETGSVSFFEVRPDARLYDSLRTKQAVNVRYLPRKDVPDVPGARFLWELHALPTARLADFETPSRLAALRTPGMVLAGEILGGIGILLLLWWITHQRLLAWAAGLGALPLLALIILQGFPRATPAPAREVRRASGRVTGIGRIDKLFSGSRSRGVIADQPVDVVSVEFVPVGRTEPVVAVDPIDRGSLPGLKERDTVPIDYESGSPRTAHIYAATRQFPDRNFSGAMVAGIVYVLVVIGLLGAAILFGRGYKRLVARR